MPSAAEIESSGFAMEDYEPDPVDIWPDNWQSWRLFTFMQTQWRFSGMGGHEGLDYNVMYRELDDRGIVGEEREQLKADIREMEFAALDEMRKKP